MSTRIVYIVDDGADYRFLLQHLFTQYLSTYPVRFFASGRALLDVLSPFEPRPDLILLDRHMPHLDGHQTLLELKKNPVVKHIPVVMMSADATVGEIDGCYEAGATSFLRKEVDLTALKDMLETVCRYWLDINQRPT